MDKEGLLERYEALGEEDDFVAAKPLYEQALAQTPDPRVLNAYGYVLECHARELRRAVELYEQAISLDPGYDKPHYQLISARAGLQEPELPVAIYEHRLAASPDKREGASLPCGRLCERPRLRAGAGGRRSGARAGIGRRGARRTAGRGEGEHG